MKIITLYEASDGSRHETVLSCRTREARLRRKGRLTEYLTAACGHTVEFKYYPDGAYTEQKRAKVLRRACGPCLVAEHNAAQEAQAAAAKESAELETSRLPGIAKGQEVQALPAGVFISLIKQSDGTWDGLIYDQGRKERAVGPGIKGVISQLARAWLETAGMV